MHSSQRNRDDRSQLSYQIDAELNRTSPQLHVPFSARQAILCVCCDDCVLFLLYLKCRLTTFLTFQIVIDLEFKSGDVFKRVIEPQTVELCGIVSAGGGIANAFVSMVFAMFKESAPRVFMPCPHVVS